MTETAFRELVLSLPEVSEGEHMGHPDFRVGGKIFATLGATGPGLAMVKLTPEQQELFVATAPAIFTPVPGGWGRGGATVVNLRAAAKKIVLEAIRTAWRNRAPKKVLLDKRV